MAVTYRTIGADTYGTDTSAETAAPSGVVSGDLLLLALAIRSASAGSRRTPTTPTGWTLIDSSLDPSGAVADQYVYRRIADGTGDDTPTVTLSDAPDGWQTRIIRIDGHDPTTPVQTSATATGDLSSDTSEIPVATVDRDGSIAFCCAVKLSGSTNFDIVWPTGWTELYNDHATGFRSTASAGYDPVDAGAMASGQNTSGWTTSTQTVQRVTVIVQPPAGGGGVGANLIRGSKLNRFSLVG